MGLRDAEIDTFRPPTQNSACARLVRSRGGGGDGLPLVWCHHCLVARPGLPHAIGTAWRSPSGGGSTRSPALRHGGVGSLLGITNEAELRPLAPGGDLTLRVLLLLPEVKYCPKTPMGPLSFHQHPAQGPWLLCYVVDILGYLYLIMGIYYVHHAAEGWESTGGWEGGSGPLSI